MVETACGLCFWGEPAGPRLQVLWPTARMCTNGDECVNDGCHDMQTLATGQERQYLLNFRS